MSIYKQVLHENLYEVNFEYFDSVLDVSFRASAAPQKKCLQCLRNTGILTSFKQLIA